MLAGNGPVYNVGERVEAFTSPLWLGIVVVLRVITGGLVPYEWLVVVAGAGLAVAGTVGLCVGSVALWTPLGQPAREAWWLPGGLLVVVSLSAVWDFSSAGLETGLGMGWIGWSFAATVATLRRSVARDRVHAGVSPRRSTGLPVSGHSTGPAAERSATVGRVRLLPVLVLVGLGPLVRPELALYSAAFGVTLVALAWYPVRHVEGTRRWWRSWGLRRSSPRDQRAVVVAGEQQAVGTDRVGVGPGSPGHTHQLPAPWRRARAGVAGADVPGSEAAARALACGALGGYLADIHRPMTAGRFLANVVSAPGNTTLDIPADPVEAEARFCR